MNKTFLIVFILILNFLCTSPERDNPFDQNSSTFGEPTVIAQNDTTIDINDSIIITAVANDNRGVDKLVWYGSVNDTSDSNFIITSFSEIGFDTLFVIAIDIDGVKSKEDTVIISVTQKKPAISQINDTLLSETMNLEINVDAKDVNSSGKIVEYLWDIGADGWDDSTTISTYLFDSSIGDTTEIIVAAIDDDDLMSADTFVVMFNRVPEKPEISFDSLWVDYDFVNQNGKILCYVNAEDSNGPTDILTYCLKHSTDSINWLTGYSGKDTVFEINNLSPSFTNYYRLFAFDLYGDSSISTGKVLLPKAPFVPIDKEYIVGNGMSFLMGSEDGSSNEDPVHLVNLTYDFWIDQTEVMQKKYTDVMSLSYNNFVIPPWNSTYGIGDSIPAYFVNWYDAVLYCNALSKINDLDTIYSYSEIIGIPGNDCVLSDVSIDLTLKGFRLPTEAEWEFAGRAGDTTSYFWGSSHAEIDKYAWYGNNSDYVIHSAALKLPNDNNLFDISGNLWEWCNDYYDEYTATTKTDPSGPITGSYKVKRGGAWNLSNYFCRISVRNSSLPNACDAYIGFRTVLPN